MKRHLHKIGSDPYLYSDSGHSDLSNHPKLQEGWEIVDGLPPEGAERFDPLKKSKEISAMVASLDVVDQVQIGNIMMVAKPFLDQGDMENLKLVVEQSPNPYPEGTPPHAQMETLRQSILDKINE